MCSTTTGACNTAVGHLALSLATTTTKSTAVGSCALQRTTAFGNTAIGSNASCSLTTGQRNVTLGYDANISNQTGSCNVIIGGAAMWQGTNSKNVALGFQAGSDTTSGSNLIVIGTQAQPSSATATNEITLGSTSHSCLRIPGLNIHANSTGLGIGTNSPSEKLDVSGNAKFTQTFITEDDKTNVFREITQVESSAQGWMVSTGALPIPSPGIYRVTAFVRLRWNVGSNYYKMALFSSTSNTSNLTQDRMIIEHIEDDHGGFANVGMSADWIIDVPTGNTNGANVYVGFFAQAADSVFRIVNDGNGRPYFMATKLRETTTSGTTLAEIRSHN